MAVVSMKALLESGVHFGHRTNKWHPGMKPYIFTERNGIHIIDLQQTVKALNAAYAIIRDSVANRGIILFVGTKRQAQETVHDEATRCGMPYVTERWLGGMLTNWTTMHKRIMELDRLEKMIETGDIERLTKKEGLLIRREIARLETRLAGVRTMGRLPDLVFVVDVSREDAAVHEANLLDIPIVAMVDTNCNPSNIDYVIPSNDDAIRAIKLLVGKIADAVLEGKAMRKDEELEAEAEAARAAQAGAAPVREVDIVEAEEELGDEALLGEATLAKLTPREIPEVEEEEEVEVETETKEKEKDKKKPRAKAKEAVVVEEEIVNEEVAEAKEAVVVEEEIVNEKVTEAKEAVVVKEEIVN
ncbi:MAG: 30S ribosomal protein S2, partial [Anaerolineae bacterium CG_4_9_14_0_8_um_filter_58_9]